MDSGEARPKLWGYPGLAPGGVRREQGSGVIALAHEKWVVSLGRCGKRRRDEEKKVD
jgi:hypothetical protein